MQLSRREFLKDIGLTAAVIGTLSVNGCQMPEVKMPEVKLPEIPIPGIKKKTNIIYILADDFGYGDLGCYGQKQIKTPNLDRMAAEGMKFTQHYAGSTVCAPSRCCLMTGKHTGHCTVRGNVDVLMKPDEVTIAKILKRAGYATACIGKWGIGHPPLLEDPHNNGFDYFFGYLSMWHAHNYYPDFLWKNGQKVPLGNVVQHPKKYDKENQEQLVGLASEKIDYSPDLFTQNALEYIKEQKEPFFLFISYTIPHANNEASLFREHGMEVPDYGIYADKDWPEPEKGKAAMISRMDGYIGTLFDKLKESGIDDNTLVMFSSDNGPHKEGGVRPEFFKSNNSFKGIKRDLYEGGIRVPMLARWPGKITPNSQCNHISAFWDVLPTLAEIAEVQQSKGIDGISFAPSLLGKPQDSHEYLYWEFHEGGSKQAVRIGKWKAVRPAPSRAIELYNLYSDIDENKNIAKDHPDIVARAREIMDTARTDADVWPLQD
ncbi:MAG: arylsulfatase [Sedimentisphaerales bacterium]|nr:arylsulfatase [Sedimentisphaerales bacterium]